MSHWLIKFLLAPFRSSLSSSGVYVQSNLCKRIIKIYALYENLGPISLRSQPHALTGLIAGFIAKALNAEPIHAQHFSLFLSPRFSFIVDKAIHGAKKMKISISVAFVLSH